MFSFLTPPLFADPEKIYQPLPAFAADGKDEPKSRQEILDAIAKLNEAAREFSSSKNFTRDYLALIAQAEAQAAKQQWCDARRTLWEATFFLNRALESKAASKFRKCIGVYYGCWLLALVIIGRWLKGLEGGEAAILCFGLPYWRYVMMGALGGLTIAVWGLTKHSAELDFDRAYAVWYWLRPLLGAVMGLIAVLTVQAGLFAVEGEPSLKGRTALYILAFLAGFSERFFIRVLDRVMTALFSSETATTAARRPAPARSQTASPES
ncbi:MAG TPA: hypothetical protein VI136_00900 [Verrucomicrobiae bacterium]